MATATEDNIKEIGGTKYVLRLFNTTDGLNIMKKLFTSGGFDDDVIKDVITKGVSIGSTSIDAKKFDNHFRGKYTELFELFNHVLVFNNMEINEKSEGSEE